VEGSAELPVRVAQARLELDVGDRGQVGAFRGRAIQSVNSHTPYQACGVT
jgi:hypothetical protein